MSHYNIWDIAVDKSKKIESESKPKMDSVMLVVGSKNSGKTSLCNKFVEKNDIPKPTLALEYSFCRRIRSMDLDKDVCHIWELGGGTIFSELLEIPITLKNLLSLIVVLVLDLSSPEELWFTMETLLGAVKKRIREALKSGMNRDLKHEFEGQLKRRLNIENLDGKYIDPFPVPLLIVGSKFDLFQDIESEKRKLICKCLRYAAHMNGASLQFISNRTETLMNKARLNLSNMVFGTAPSKSFIVDYNKPLCTMFGKDSLQAIGTLPNPENISLNVNVHSLDVVRTCFSAFYPQVEQKHVVPDDPGSDPLFKEHDLDVMRAQKDEELGEYRRKMKEKRLVNDQKEQ